VDDIIKHWKERNPHLSIAVDCSDEMDTLPEEMSIHLYRVIQECITNTVRHAEAQHINIIQIPVIDWVICNISDFGWRAVTVITFMAVRD
jgi:signal transduction histidine kinase